MLRADYFIINNINNMFRDRRARARSRSGAMMKAANARAQRVLYTARLHLVWQDMCVMGRRYSFARNGMCALGCGHLFFFSSSCGFRVVDLRAIVHFTSRNVDVQLAEDGVSDDGIGSEHVFRCVRQDRDGGNQLPDSFRSCFVAITNNIELLSNY